MEWWNRVSGRSCSREWMYDVAVNKYVVSGEWMCGVNWMSGRAELDEWMCGVG